MDMINRSNWSGTHIREKMIKNQDWRSDVPRAVADIIDEIDGISRIQDLAKTDEDVI